MSFKRGFLILFVLLLFTSILCSCGDVIVEPKGIIGVKGADTAVFSSLCTLAPTLLLMAQSISACFIVILLFPFRF